MFKPDVVYFDIFSYRIYSLKYQTSSGKFIEIRKIVFVSNEFSSFSTNLLRLKYFIKNKTYFTQKMNSVNIYIKDIGRYYRQNTMKISSTFLATRKMTEKFAF